MNYRKGNTYADIFYYRCTNDKGQIVCSFSANDSIFVYTKNGDYVGKYEAKSKYSTKFIPFDLSKIMNMDYARKYTFTNHWYTDIVYDKYRKLYYRFYKKEAPFLNDEGNIRRPDEIPWSLIILDASFNKINEVDINPAKYSLSNLIVTKEGLYIGHPYTEDIKNNSLSLTLIKLNSDFE